MGIVYPLYYSASLHVWKFLAIEWKKFKITERMSWVNEDVCLQVVARELNGQLPRWTLARFGAPPRPVPRVVPGGCAPLREPRGEERPVRAFARPPWKRAAERQAARRAASKPQAPREEKGQCAFPKLKSPSPGTAARGGGGEGAESALEQCGQSGRGRPVGTKGPQCWRGGRPGAWWQHKGKLCPRGTQGHLCLPSPSQRKVTEGASRLSSLLRDLVTGMAKLFLQDAGNSDENSNVLAC